MLTVWSVLFPACPCRAAGSSLQVLDLGRLKLRGDVDVLPLLLSLGGADGLRSLTLRAAERLRDDCMLALTQLTGLRHLDVAESRLTGMGGKHCLGKHCNWLCRCAVLLHPLCMSGKS